MKIYKYPLDFAERQTLTLPIGSDLLHVAEQGDLCCLWVRIPEDVIETEDRVIVTAPTGESPIDDSKIMLHISTVLMDGGRLVWHFFEETDLDRMDA